ncbi:MAG: magnesium transporter [Eubacteriales bacterium]|nr:magnesium transporter [Eubacteriales bacterium]
MNEKILELLKSKDYSALKALLAGENPQDIASAITKLDEEQIPIVFRVLPKELAAEAFVEMDPDGQELLIKSFSDVQLKQLFDELYLDDTVDIIEEMPANVVKRILRSTDLETRCQINELLHYPEDSAGSIMTTEYVTLRPAMTVEEAILRIRRTGIDKETVYTCYVTSSDSILLGVITVKDLLVANDDAIVGDIMDTHVIYAETNQDKENVAREMAKYDFLAIPVVDNEKRLVGIVTFDDAIDVIEDEATEDIEKMAAILPSDKPYLKTGVLDTWKKRIPWLLLLMISATFTGQIITNFESALAGSVALTAFIPMLMDTGGNSGSQASVTIIRGLALQEINMKDILNILWKELRVSLLCGVSLACANFAKIMLVDNLVFHNSVSVPIAAVVCITLVVVVFCAKLVGSTLPILAKRIGFDPAVMASPFITTIVDAISLLVYFNIAKLMITNL